MDKTKRPSVPVFAFPRAAWRSKLHNTPACEKALAKLDHFLAEAWCSSAKYNPEDDLVNTLLVDAAVAATVEAVRTYQMHKAYMTHPTKFRELLRETRREVKRLDDLLSKLIPLDDALPPWPQMRAIFTGGDPFAYDLSRDGDISKEDEWEQRFHPGRVREVPATWLRLIDDLLEKASSRGRPHDVPEQLLLNSLGWVWTDEIGAELKLTQ
jgi:hypothetical protein